MTVTVYHADHAISEKQQAFIVSTLRRSAPQGFFIQQVNIPRGLGSVPNALYGPDAGDLPVREEEVYYASRGGRPVQDRLVRATPRPWSYVQAIGVRDGDDFTIFTIYGGPLAPMHPDDPNNRDPEGSRDWWSQHALADGQWSATRNPSRGASRRARQRQRQQYERLMSYGEPTEPLIGGEYTLDDHMRRHQLGYWDEDRDTPAPFEMHPDEAWRPKRARKAKKNPWAPSGEVWEHRRWHLPLGATTSAAPEVFYWDDLDDAFRSDDPQEEEWAAELKFHRTPQDGWRWSHDDGMGGTYRHEAHLVPRHRRARFNPIGKKVGKKVSKKAAAKLGAKAGGKLVPGVGQAMMFAEGGMVAVDEAGNVVRQAVEGYSQAYETGKEAWQDKSIRKAGEAGWQGAKTHFGTQFGIAKGAAKSIIAGLTAREAAEAMLTNPKSSNRHWRRDVDFRRPSQRPETDYEWMTVEGTFGPYSIDIPTSPYPYEIPPERAGTVRGWGGDAPYRGSDEHRKKHKQRQKKKGRAARGKYNPPGELVSYEDLGRGMVIWVAGGWALVEDVDQYGVITSRGLLTPSHHAGQSFRQYEHAGRNNPRQSDVEMYEDILAHLRALQWVYTTTHWTSAGPNSYGDHLLLQRLYEGLDKPIDALGERMVAYFGPGSVNPLLITNRVQGIQRMISEGRFPEFDQISFPYNMYEVLLMLENRLQNRIRKAWKANQDSGDEFSLGIDDYLMGLANDRDEAIYLLKQRLGSP